MNSRIGRDNKVNQLTSNSNDETAKIENGSSRNLLSDDSKKQTNEEQISFIN